MPAALAVRKWPSSWRTMHTTRARTRSTVTPTPAANETAMRTATTSTNRSSAALSAGSSGSVGGRRLAMPKGSPRRASRNPTGASSSCSDPVGAGWPVVTGSGAGAPGHRGGGQLPSAAVGVEHVVHGTGEPLRVLVEGIGDDVGYVHPTDPPGQERLDGDLVGAVEAGGRRPTAPSGPVGEIEAGKGLPVRRGELE